MGLLCCLLLTKLDINLICEYTKKTHLHIRNCWVKIYFSLFTNCPQAAAMSVKEYDNQLQALRSEYINTKTYMRDTRVN